MMTMKKVHFTRSFWMLLRLKFRFNCKDLINISRKNRSRGRKHVINHIKERSLRGVQRDIARTHTHKQRERYTMRRSTRAHRSSSGKEEGKEKRNLESPFPIRKRSEDTSEFEEDFVETTTKKTKRMGGHSVAANEEAKIKTRSSKQKKRSPSFSNEEGLKRRQRRRRRMMVTFLPKTRRRKRSQRKRLRKRRKNYEFYWSRTTSRPP